MQDEHNLYWYHYGARYYDPQLGRWQSIDPADEFTSAYVYVRNMPTKFIDPDGNKIGIDRILWEYNTSEFNFQSYSVDSEEFKRFVGLFGKGGPLEKYEVDLHLDLRQTTPEEVILLADGRRPENLNIDLKGRWEMIKGANYTQFMDVNPSYSSFDKQGYSSVDHGLSHVAYNVYFIIKNEQTSDPIIMVVGGSQDYGGPVSYKHNLMTIAKLLKDLNPDDPSSIKDIQSRINIIEPEPSTVGKVGNFFKSVWDYLSGK